VVNRVRETVLHGSWSAGLRLGAVFGLVLAIPIAILLLLTDKVDSGQWWAILLFAMSVGAAGGAGGFLVTWAMWTLAKRATRAR
jgi:hypothetical protein